MRQPGLFLLEAVMEIIYRAPKTNKEFEQYFALRWELLRKPLGLERGSEQDNLEMNSFHIAAYKNKKVIGVGRIHIEPDNSMRIRYMAIHEEFQQQGIGSNILKLLEKHARLNNVQICWLYARENAINFYIKNGYEKRGKNNSELVEITHKRMEKCLK